MSHNFPPIIWVPPIHDGPISAEEYSRLGKEVHERRDHAFSLGRRFHIHITDDHIIQGGEKGYVASTNPIENVKYMPWVFLADFILHTSDNGILTVLKNRDGRTGVLQQVS